MGNPTKTTGKAEGSKKMKEKGMKKNPKNVPTSPAANLDDSDSSDDKSVFSGSGDDNSNTSKKKSDSENESSSKDSNDSNSSSESNEKDTVDSLGKTPKSEKNLSSKKRKRSNKKRKKNKPNTQLFTGETAPIINATPENFIDNKTLAATHETDASTLTHSTGGKKNRRKSYPSLDSSTVTIAQDLVRTKIFRKVKFVDEPAALKLTKQIMQKLKVPPEDFTDKIVDIKTIIKDTLNTQRSYANKNVGKLLIGKILYSLNVSTFFKLTL